MWWLQFYIKVAALNHPPPPPPPPPHLNLRHIRLIYPPPLIRPSRIPGAGADVSTARRPHLFMMYD